jgi:hypothetical protein
MKKNRFSSTPCPISFSVSTRHVAHTNAHGFGGTKDSKPAQGKEDIVGWGTQDTRPVQVSLPTEINRV